MSTGTIHFYDDKSAELHDRRVYDILRSAPEDIGSTTVHALLASLDDHDLKLITSCTDWSLVDYKASLVREYRETSGKAKNVTHRPNYPIGEVLDDYRERRRGRVREARRQLRARFDGLDHDMQEAVMMAFMAQGTEKDREFVCDKLYGDDLFWSDAYVPLVERWWEEYHDGHMCKVVVKRCSREYVMEHLGELQDRCNYATLCLKTGMTPEEGRLPYRTHLFVLKGIGAQLRPREGEETVLKWVREYLYEDREGTLYDSIFEIPYVRRMMLYLGEMHLTDDIQALEAFDRRMRATPRQEWCTAVIRAIEEEFALPEYVFKCIE